MLIRILANRVTELEQLLSECKLNSKSGKEIYITGQLLIIMRFHVLLVNQFDRTDIDSTLLTLLKKTDNVKMLLVLIYEISLNT